jgi:hypothetical protein
MDTKTIFVLTPKGDEEVAHKTSLLYGDIKRALSMIDGVSTYAEISKRAAPSLRTILAELVKELLTGGFIQDKSRAGFMAKIIVPAKSASAPAPSTPPKQEQGGSELDFTTIMRAPSADMLRAEAAKFQAEQIARKEAEQQKLKAEQEAVKAKQMADAENARRAQEHEARLKAVQEAEARAKHEAEEKARKEAEARAKHEAEEKARKEAEARAKHEAEEKARKEAEARAKHEAEEKARKETEARAKHESEEKARKEAEARAKHEAEEKARKEAELAREEAERKARVQAEIVRLKAEQEAEKARIEAELAKKKAEAEAREAAERRAKAEIEAARSDAEKEAAKAKAELEQARIKAEAEAKLMQEAEAARLQAEQDAAQARAEVERVKKESELAAAQAKEEAEQIKKEAELMAAQAKQEADRARQEAEAARLKAEAEAEAARLKAEAEAARAREELEAARLKVEQEEIARAEAETARLAAEHIAAQALVVAEQKKLQELEQLAIQAREEEKIRAKQHALAAASTQVRDTPYDTSKPPEPSALKLDAFDLDALDIKPDPAVAAAKASAQASEAARASEIKAQGPSAEELKAKELALKEQAKKAEEARLAEELSAKKLADAQAKAWAEAEKRAAQSAKAHVEHLAQQSAQNVQAKQQGEMKLKAAMKKKRKPVPWTGIAIGVLLIAVLAVFIVPMTLPTQQYANNLEVMLAKNLKQPVHIGKMSLRILPTPRIDLGEIYIGEVKQVKAQQAQLNFGFGALFSDVKRVERLELQGAELNNSGLLIVPAWLQQMSADAKYPISHIAFSGMKVNGDVVQFTDVDGEVDFSPKGQITGALLHAKGGKYALDIKATPEGKFATTFNLRNSALPLLPNWSFDDMTAKGELTQDGLVVSEFDSRIAGGVLQGDAQLDWKNGWSVQGSLNAKSMSLASLSKLLEGDMDGVARFKMQADSLANLADSSSLDGTLVAKKGLINGVDIVETARLHSKDHLPGGRTHFDQLDSTLLYAGNAYHFKSIKIVNSVMNASANVDIVKQQLSGRISAHLSITEGMGTVDLQVGGASDNPNLRAIR